MSVITINQAVEVLKQYIDERLQIALKALNEFLQEEDTQVVIQNIDDISKVAQNINTLCLRL